MLTEAAAAATATQANQSPGLFLLAWGLIASVIGLLSVTNYRGFAEKFAREAEASRLRRRRRWSQSRPLDPASATWRMRLIAIPFAIAGPIVTVVGLVSISHGQISGPGTGPLPSPFRYVVIAVVVAGMAQLWLSPRGPFRLAARRGGRRLAAALLASAGGLVFGIGFVLGYTVIAIAAWVICGIPYLFLILSSQPPGPGPGDIPD